MTTIPLEVSIGRSDVLHFLGYPEGRLPAGRIAPLLDETIREARRLADARGAFKSLPASAASEVGLAAESADGLVIGLVTAGSGIERRVTELLGEGDHSRALLLDAAGSAAVEEAARRLSVLAVGGGTRRTRGTIDVSCRISPGYGAWPLASQKALFALLPHEELGVSLSSSMMMSPRKSVSFALLIGARGLPLSGLSGCKACGLATCRMRRSEAPGRSASRDHSSSLDARSR
jgi:hypothetical protein